MRKRAVVIVPRDDFAEVIAPGLPDIAVDYVTTDFATDDVLVFLTGDGLPDRCTWDKAAPRVEVVPLRTIRGYLDESVSIGKVDGVETTLSRRDAVIAMIRWQMGYELPQVGSEPFTVDLYGAIEADALDTISTLLGVDVAHPLPLTTRTPEVDGS